MWAIPVIFALGASALFAAARRSTTHGTLPRTYDAVFRGECPNLPVEFLRALAKKESDLNPNESSGPAWGLMQITEPVRVSYNRRHRTAFSRRDLLNPNVSVRVGCDLLTTIAASYASNHPRAVPAVDWRNPRFVELVVLGWNAGYSEGAGVGAAIRFLERKGVNPGTITVDTVFRAAQRNMQLSRFLRSPARIAYAKSVSDLYFKELAGPATA